MDLVLLLALAKEALPLIQGIKALVLAEQDAKAKGTSLTLDQQKEILRNSQADDDDARTVFEKAISDAELEEAAAAANVGKQP